LDALGNLWPYAALLLTASSRCSYIAPISGREALEQRAAPRLARNNNMRLVEPAEQWRAAFLDMASEYSAAGDHRYDLALHDFGAYLRRIAEGRRTEGLPPGRVPGTECWLEEAGRIVACVRLRFLLTPELEREGGHVGYDVRPSMRRCGYGTALLRLVLPLVRQHGIQRVRITCDADNIGSRKIISGTVMYWRAKRFRTTAGSWSGSTESIHDGRVPLPYPAPNQALVAPR
jgi:predicted acetyltransferase